MYVEESGQHQRNALNPVAPDEGRPATIITPAEQGGRDQGQAELYPPDSRARSFARQPAAKHTEVRSCATPFFLAVIIHEDRGSRGRLTFSILSGVESGILPQNS